LHRSRAGCDRSATKQSVQAQPRLTRWSQLLVVWIIVYGLVAIGRWIAAGFGLKKS
jgi:hypothetical protein